MWRRVRSLSLLFAVLALSVLVAPGRALADGEVVASVADPLATTAGSSVATCHVAGYARWIGYPEGDFDVVIGGATTCTRLMQQVTATVELLAADGTTVLLSRTCPPRIDTACPVPSIGTGALPGDHFSVRYSTMITTQFPFTWALPVPTGCVRVTAQKLTCVATTPFTVG
jgi:hypothetical protein